MDEDISGRTAVAQRRSSPWPMMLAVALGFFLLGGGAVWVAAGKPGMPAYFKNSANAPAAVRPQPVATQGSVASAEAHQAAQQVAQVAQQQGGLDQRVAAMEQRITRLDLQAQAAEGNASRAEGLLIAFAARRAMERGQGLGYLEDQLRLRFGDAQPNAVQALIDASKRPVTLDQLLARLGGLSPALSSKPRGEGALSWLSRTFSDLFVVRRADTPSPAAENRLARARIFLETGRADLAASEVRGMPNAPAAREWIADADRYAAAQRSLDLLEMTAIQEPRDLRDAIGRPIEQPSPLG